MLADIPSFIKLLQRENELIIIEEECDPCLEIAEIHRRVIAANGPALLFTNPKGYKIPVATNLFGTKRRVELAFGKRPKDFVEQAVRLSHEIIPPTFGKIWAEKDFFLQAFKLGSRTIHNGPILDVINSPGDISKIPMLKSWPQDGGDFVTLPLVYTEHPEDGRHNLGMYRIQRHSPTTTGMHWQIGKGGGFHHHMARERGENLPVTVFVGGPPALILSAIAPLPENVPELLLASLLLGERLPVVKSPTAHPHRLIAGCEFAFAGHVKPNDFAPEGPFGDHYGYYSLQHDYPVFHLDTLFQRKDAVWPATIVGKPRQEDLYIGDYLQDLLSPIFPLVMPSVKDLWSYGETGYHALASAVVEERYHREAMQAAFRILGEGQLSLTKFLWLVDKPMDLSDPKQVLTHILERFHPETDLYVLSNLSMDTLDYSGPEVNLGSKGVMLGIGDPYRSLPKTYSGETPSEITEIVPFCPGCLLVSGPVFEAEPELAQRIGRAFPDWPLVILVENAARVASSDIRFLWSVFTRFEPANDISATETRINRHHLVYGGTIFIDSRMKPGYPDELTCDEITSKLVTKRWNDYFPSAKVEMGDSDSAHLDAQ
jgi:UbiD family decarboxylase